MSPGSGILDESGSRGWSHDMLSPRSASVMDCIIDILLTNCHAREMSTALAPRAIVHCFVTKDVTVDAEMVLTRLTFVPA